MKELNTKEVCEILNEIMEYELGGVVRYTHSSLMITGPYRIPIVAFLKETKYSKVCRTHLPNSLNLQNVGNG